MYSDVKITSISNSFYALLYVPIKGAAPRGTIADLGGGFLPPKMKYKIR